MTKEEKIIATAFTGIMFIDGSDMGLLYEYMEKKVGHGVIDLMLAGKGFWEELHKACEKDFIDMTSKEQPFLPSNIDKAAIDFADNARKQLYSKDYAIASIADYDHGCIDGFKAGAKWQYQKDRYEFAKLKAKECMSDYPKQRRASDDRLFILAEIVNINPTKA